MVSPRRKGFQHSKGIIYIILSQVSKFLYLAIFSPTCISFTNKLIDLFLDHISGKTVRQVLAKRKFYLDLKSHTSTTSSIKQLVQDLLALGGVRFKSNLKVKSRTEHLSTQEIIHSFQCSTENVTPYKSKLYIYLIVFFLSTTGISSYTPLKPQQGYYYHKKCPYL